MTPAERAAAMALKARAEQPTRDQNRQRDPAFTAFLDDYRKTFEGAELWRYESKDFEWMLPRHKWSKGSDALRDACLARPR